MTSFRFPIWVSLADPSVSSEAWACSWTRDLKCRGLVLLSHHYVRA